MKIRKYEASDKGLLTIRCLSCGGWRMYSTDELKDKHLYIKVECSCGATILLHAEYRLTKGPVDSTNLLSDGVEWMLDDYECTVLDLANETFSIQIDDIPEYGSNGKLLINLLAENRS